MIPPTDPNRPAASTDLSEAAAAESVEGPPSEATMALPGASVAPTLSVDLPGMSGALSSDSLFPGYEILDELGRGGMGIVYRARDKKTGQILALKTLQGFSAAALYRFKYEFRALANVTHPNLVSLYELVSDGENWWMTMEIVEGVDFRSYVRGPLYVPGTPLSAGQIHRLRDGLRQVAEAVVALHDADRIHRDIKPRNVMVTPAGRVVLLDFGLAAELDARGVHASAEQHILGTIAYMSPEQSAARPVSSATDWYSVGVMLYELLAGTLPFSGPVLELVRAKHESVPAPPRTVAPDVPADLESLCLALLSREPQDRPTGRDVLQFLVSEPDDSSAAATPEPRDTPFVGRDVHLQLLRDAFAAMRTGKTATVGLHGRSGTGKSCLAQHFQSELGGIDDAIVLGGRCYEHESVPYKALDSLVDSLTRCLRLMPAAQAQSVLPRNFAALTRLFPVMRQLEPLLGPATATAILDHQELRRRGFAALRELLARLGDRWPLVLVIDDLQWGDLDSARLVSDLLRPPDAPVLLLVSCYRSEDAHSSPFLREFLESVRQLQEAGSIEHFDVEVSALSEADARELAYAILRTREPHIAPLVEAIARESRGISFFVHELAQHLRSETEGETESRSTLSLDQMLWDRIKNLPEEPRRLLEVVAVAGRPLLQSDALKAAGITDRGVLAVLVGRHLMRTTRPADESLVETYHDRVRETVVARLAMATYQAHQLALAQTLEASTHADPKFLALHYHEAGELEKAGEYYTQAAALAADALAFDRAVALYQDAIRLLKPTDTALRNLRTELGHALANSGRGKDAAEQFALAAEGAPELEAIELQRLASQQYLISGFLIEGLTLFRRVAQSTHIAWPKSRSRAVWSILWRQAFVSLFGTRFREREAATIDRRELLRIDIYWAASIGLSMSDTLYGAEFHSRHLRAALRVGEPSRVSTALSMECGHHASAGKMASAYFARMHARAKELAEKAGSPYARAFVKLTGGSAAAWCNGRWEQAVEDGREAVRIFQEQCTGVAWEIDTCHVFELAALIWMGRICEHKTRLQELLEDAGLRGDIYARATLPLLSCGHLRLLAEDAPDSGRAVLKAAMELWTAPGFHLQHFYFYFGQSECDLYAGEFDRALQSFDAQWRPFTDAFLLRVQAVQIFARHLRARARLAVWRQRQSSLSPAEAGTYRKFVLSEVRAISKLGAAWSPGLATLLRASVQSLSGNPITAAAELKLAIGQFEEARMGLYSAASRRRLGELVHGEEGRRLITQADEWMTAETIRNPARMTALVAPGFP